MRRDAKGFQVGTDTQRRDDRHGVFAQQSHGRVVEMIVVIVREHDRVERRQLPQLDRNRLKAFRPEEARR